MASFEPSDDEDSYDGAGWTIGYDEGDYDDSKDYERERSRSFTNGGGGRVVRAAPFAGPEVARQRDISRPSPLLPPSHLQDKPPHQTSSSAYPALDALYDRECDIRRPPLQFFSSESNWGGGGISQSKGGSALPRPAHRERSKASRGCVAGK
jgi:hypothetical protein